MLLSFWTVLLVPFSVFYVLKIYPLLEWRHHWVNCSRIGVRPARKNAHRKRYESSSSSCLRWLCYAVGAIEIRGFWSIEKHQVPNQYVRQLGRNCSSGNNGAGGSSNNRSQARAAPMAMYVYLSRYDWCELIAEAIKSGALRRPLPKIDEKNMIKKWAIRTIAWT